jgi:hypothetical protein
MVEFLDVFKDCLEISGIEGMSIDSPRVSKGGHFTEVIIKPLHAGIEVGIVFFVLPGVLI